MELLELGKLIQAKRKEKKITQQELALQCGISTRTISSIESGFNVDVGIYKVAIVLEVLGLELDIRQARSPLSLDELNRNQS